MGDSGGQGIEGDFAKSGVFVTGITSEMDWEPSDVSFSLVSTIPPFSNRLEETFFACCMSMKFDRAFPSPTGRSTGFSCTTAVCILVWLLLARSAVFNSSSASADTKDPNVGCFSTFGDAVDCDTTALRNSIFRGDCMP